MNSKVSVKWALMFGVPVVLLVVLAYVFVRSENRALESKQVRTEQEIRIYEGELYKLRQERDGLALTLSQLQDPRYQRFFASGFDSTSGCWLYWRQQDSMWFGRVWGAVEGDAGKQLRLYARQGTVFSYVGAMELVNETIGMQRIGASGLQQSLHICVEPSDAAPFFDPTLERFSYPSSSAQASAARE